MKGEIILNSKTGFQALDTVKVNKDGFPFYYFSKKGKILFNLPPGKYEFLTEAEKRNRPVKVSVPKKRKRENYDYKAPEKGLKVVYTSNPNKASIRPFEGLITIDSSFLNKAIYPEYVPRYLLLHEIGHFYYDSEDFCDEFARDKMLEEGYNLSQVENASKLTLHHGHERHVKCLEGVSKAKIK